MGLPERSPNKQEEFIANDSSYLAFSVGQKVLIEKNYVKLFEQCYEACNIEGKINAHKLARRYIVYQVLKKINSYPSRGPMDAPWLQLSLVFWMVLLQ